MKNTRNIDVYATGGGFYTAETKLSGGYMATLEFPFSPCLTVYKNTEYYEENMIYSKPIEDLDEEECELFDELFNALKNHLAHYGKNIKMIYDIETGYHIADENRNIID